MPKFRITLWDISANNGFRGSVKAIIFDAKNIGVEDRANDVGSAFWTLDNDHPQITECVPLSRHYEIARWSATRNQWEFVGAGMLNDYSVTEYQTVFNGIDYKAVFNQISTPLIGATTDNAAALSTMIPANGVSDASDIPFRTNVATSTTTTRYSNVGTGTIDWSEEPYTKTFAGRVEQVTDIEYNSWTTAWSTDGFSLTGVTPVVKNVDVNNATSYWKTPGILLSYTSVHTSNTTAGFPTSPKMYFRVHVSPPGYRDAGAPPLDNLGLIGQYYDSSKINPTGALTNGTTWGPYLFFFIPQETSDAMEDAGYPFGGSYTIPSSYTAADALWDNPISALRNGVTYTFQVYAAILRTSTDAWFRTSTGPISYVLSSTNNPTTVSATTLGQAENELFKDIVNRTFDAAKNVNTYSRIRFANIYFNDDSATTAKHNSFSAGEPVLQYISSLADIEMGTRTNGSKVLFDIDKPASGGTYLGNFRVYMNVSSNTVSNLVLKYPENVKSYSYTPGYSRVRNDITVIPVGGYLSGSSGQLVSGSSLIGATAVDTSSQSSNGYIPLIATKSGLVDEVAAQNEANRLLVTYKVANTKQVNLRTVLDSVDIWYGWNLGDTVRVIIKRGLINLDEGFVITGVRWFGELDGHERIELDLMQGTAFAAAYANPAPAPATPSTPIVTPPNTTGG